MGNEHSKIQQAPADLDNSDGCFREYCSCSFPNYPKTSCFLYRTSIVNSYTHLERKEALNHLCDFCKELNIYCAETFHMKTGTGGENVHLFPF